MNDPMCRQCDYQVECRRYMDFRVDKTTVDGVKFEIVPPKLVSDLDLSKIYAEDPDAQSLQAVYTMCHETVYGTKGGSVGKDRDAIIQNASQAKCSLRLFMLTNMIGWRETHEGQVFYPKALIGKGAHSRLDVYASVCRSKFGTFDSKSLDALTGDSTQEGTNLESKMFNSEVIAGSWIVGFKATKGGNPIASMYHNKECELDPHWLAIEDSYRDILREHLVKPFGNESENRHRFTTTQIIGELKRKPTKAKAVFQARQNILPQAAQRIMGMRGLSVNDVECPKKPVLNALEFWKKIGLVVQHLECLKFVDNDYSAIHRQSQVNAKHTNI